MPTPKIRQAVRQLAGNTALHNYQVLPYLIFMGFARSTRTVDPCVLPEYVHIVESKHTYAQTDDIIKRFVHHVCNNKHVRDFTWIAGVSFLGA